MVHNEKIKKILITGASQGIGKAIYDHLKKDPNYTFICPSIDELDLSKKESVQKFIKSEKDIDIIINNAGINILKGIEEVDQESLEQMISVNLSSPLMLVSGLLCHMRKNKWGRIINLSSIWGLTSKERRVLYSVTKFGINGLTKSLAKELGPDNILVNSICPGYVNTELTQKNVSQNEQEKIKEQIPLRRFAEPAEIAHLTKFLISEENTYITGQMIAIDGGFL